MALHSPHSVVWNNSYKQQKADTSVENKDILQRILSLKVPECIVLSPLYDILIYLDC